MQALSRAAALEISNGPVLRFPFTHQAGEKS
jgi:hypothetical protein